MKLTRKDRIAGCLLGGALGDSIGAHFEGTLPQRGFSLPTFLRATDDTQLTLATCESIVDVHCVDPESIASHFLRWYRERRLSGIGSSTLKSLTELDVGGHWAMVGATGERSAGNGAAMRIAPLAFFLDPDVDTHRQTIRDVSRITHRNDEAYIGALAIVRTIRHAVSGDPLTDNVFTMLLETLPDSRVRDRLSSIKESSYSIDEYASHFESSGYVVDSVPLAILAATQSSDILETIEQLVQCGGDTDTIASMFGQIFGAAHGLESLPSKTIDQIDLAAHVREMAADLSETSLER